MTNKLLFAQIRNRRYSVKSLKMISEATHKFQRSLLDIFTQHPESRLFCQWNIIFDQIFF